MRRSDLLIVSADPTFRRRLAQSFASDRGFARLHEAGDRAQVERLVARLTPPVLLLDLPLPGYAALEGLEAIRAVSPARASPRFSARPSSGYAAGRSGSGEASPATSSRSSPRSRAGACLTRRSGSRA